MAVSNNAKGRRPRRVAAEILRELPEILRSHLELPNDILVSFLDVTVSDDLSYAKVFFTIYGEVDDATISRVTNMLNSQKGTVRHQIAQRMVMRQHPDIRFVYDSTPVRAARIEELLRQAKQDRDNAANDGDEASE